MLKMMGEYAKTGNSISSIPILKLNGEFSGIYFSIEFNNINLVYLSFCIYLILHGKNGKTLSCQEYLRCWKHNKSL